MNSFEAFYADMGDRPSGTTLDRKDNDGDYTPDNCRWATKLEQRANQRQRADAITLNGKTQSATSWQRETGVAAGVLRQRLAKGWSTDHVLNPRNFQHRLIEFDGRIQPLASWAREIGLKYSTLSQRLRKGWPMERVLSPFKETAR
jgi:hypothetical protein